MERQRGFEPYCTLSFDCDFPRDIEVLPQLADVLERAGYSASFACIGQWVRRFPDPHRRLVAGGHELINHTETHPNLYHPDYAYAREEGLSREKFNTLTREERKAEIARCHQTFVEVLDYVPAGFRTPHFGVLHVDDVYAILGELGYAFSSSLLAAGPRGGTPFRIDENIWEFPVSPCPLHPFGVFDSWHSLGKNRPAHCRPGELTTLFARLGDRVEENGGYVNVYFDPREALESGELQGILQQLQRRRIEVGTYGDLLERLQCREGTVRSSVQ